MWGRWVGRDWCPSVCDSAECDCGSAQLLPGLQCWSVPVATRAGLADSAEPYQTQPVGAAGGKAQGSSHAEG